RNTSVKYFRQHLASALLLLAVLAPLPRALAETPLPDHLQYFGYWGDSAEYMDELLGFANFISFSLDADRPESVEEPMVKAKEHGMKVVLGIGNSFLDGKMRLRENYR